MDPKLEMAIELATVAHAGQVDKGGKPYILHPLRIMDAVEKVEEKIAAVLHDIVEDTSVTLDDLRAKGFTPSVINAVDALTKRHGEDRIAAAKRAASDPIALVVKLADNADNMDISRIPNPTKEDVLRLDKYAAVRQILLDAKRAA